MSNVPLKPLDDRIVAIREEAATKTTSGLYLLPTKRKSRKLPKLSQLVAMLRKSKLTTELLFVNIPPVTLRSTTWNI